MVRIYKFLHDKKHGISYKIILYLHPKPDNTVYKITQYLGYRE